MSKAQLRASRALWLARERYRYRKWQWYKTRSKRKDREARRKRWWRLWTQAHELRVLRDDQLKTKPPFSPLFGIDFAWGKVAISTLKAHGVSFVCRYLSHDSSKNITKSEATSYAAAGIKVVLVWETTAGRALSGRNAGITDAKSAHTMAVTVGAPHDCVIYFAVDFDASTTQMKAVSDYFHGVASVLGTERVGVYGGYDTVRWLLDQSVVSHGWQTYAWSHGMWDARAQLRQFANGMTLGAVSVGATSVDFNRAVKPHYGGW